MIWFFGKSPANQMFCGTYRDEIKHPEEKVLCTQVQKPHINCTSGVLEAKSSCGPQSFHVEKSTVELSKYWHMTDETVVHIYGREQDTHCLPQQSIDHTTRCDADINA